MNFADAMAQRVIELKAERVALMRRVRTLENSRDLWRHRAMNKRRVTSWRSSQ